MLKIGHTVIHPGPRPGDPPVEIPVAEELATVPGIPTNEREVDWYAREYPLESINIAEGASRDWANAIRDRDAEIREIHEEHERLMRPLIKASRISGDLEPTGGPTGEDVSQLIKDKAREIGFVEVGITRYDYRYTFKERKDWARLEHAICLASERGYRATQTIPSAECEIEQTSTYRSESHMGLRLAEYVRSLGYYAQVHNPNDNSGAYIPMFVNAGLGQLGACGYLLSPHAGNRMQLMLITTDAIVTYDPPVDFGVHAFCQICQVCVNRCPGRALMRDKIWWRGIEKNKVYYKRCRPVMARYAGCGVCMKVCPMQKYGMVAVMQYYAETGQVLGKGTHELEGFTLPDKGYFGPGEMPVFDPKFFSDMPHGDKGHWALERFRNFIASGNPVTRESLEKFRKELTVALTPGGEGMLRDNKPNEIEVEE